MGDQGDSSLWMGLGDGHELEQSRTFHSWFDLGGTCSQRFPLLNLDIGDMDIGNHVCLSDQITVRLIQKSVGSPIGAFGGVGVSLWGEAVEPLGLPPLVPLAMFTFPLATD